MSAAAGLEPPNPRWPNPELTRPCAPPRSDGDAGIVTRHHDSLVKYYDHLEDLYNQSAKLANYATGFGDWVPAGPMGNHHLIGAFALLHDLQMGAAFFG